MALIHCHFYSETLKTGSSLYAIVPEPKRGEGANRKLPVLYLLHGIADDHSAWVRRTSVEKYAAKRGIAVIMPAVGRSFYSDMVYGPAYWTFLTEEVPFIARSLFPLSDRREDNFVAGLSMGGYGAFKWAMRCPETFAAAASLSGALDVCSRKKFWENEFRLIFGDAEIEGSVHDLFRLASDLAVFPGQKPKLFQCCGTEDYLYSDNIRFLEHARRLGLDLTYEEEPGIHDWYYWDKKIERVIEWLPLSAPVSD